MAPVVLRHNRLIGILGLPLVLFFLGALFVMALISILSPWLFDPSTPSPMKLPAWVQVVGGALLVVFVGGLVRDFWRSRHAYFQKLTLDEHGIHVESPSKPSFFVPWSTVVKVENRYPFVIRLVVADRSHSIHIINDGWFGESGNFRAARELIRNFTVKFGPAR
jgi:hypothetical protein